MASWKKHGRWNDYPLIGHTVTRSGMKPLAKNYYSKVACQDLVNISGVARPSVLFSGENFNLAIYLSSLTRQNSALSSQGIHKWARNRPYDICEPSLSYHVDKAGITIFFFPKLFYAQCIEA